jgi:membrane-bound metal-dependent hydrolase YbcI (DUF457 family)
MVNLAGHLAMALLFAAPAWLVWGRRGALGFTAFALVTSMLPDTDLVLQHYLPISHHGITHTLLFVGVVSVVAGALAARFLTDQFNDHRWIRSTVITPDVVFLFATAGFLTGGVSHIFADLLSAPDIAAPLSPSPHTRCSPVARAIPSTPASGSVVERTGATPVSCRTPRN